MEPFNIKINIATQETTLTILPTDTHEFKVIYDGGIIGGIKLQQESYQFITPQDLEPGNLPLQGYKQGVAADEPLKLNQMMTYEIVEEIKQYLSNPQ